MYPDTPEFEPSRITCPECGADNTQNGDRIIQGNMRFVVDDEGFRVIFEVECPCGDYSESLSIASTRHADTDEEDDDGPILGAQEVSKGSRRGSGE